MKIIFENENFIVVDKPAGWLSVVSRDKADPRPCVATQLQASLGTGKIWPCHRLDLEVSGLILFAKNSESHRAANHWFEHREVIKTYSTFSEIPTVQKDLDFLMSRLGTDVEWKSNLARGKKRAFESPHGKEAVTLARLIGPHTLLPSETSCLQWELKPKTGRSHQLRFEMYRHKTPIIGDALYGATTKYNPNAIALRAIQIQFLSKDFENWGLPSEIKTTALI